MLDQRRHYRVTEPDPERVISELLAGPQRLQSRVLDIGTAGAALLLPEVTDPRWAELIATLSETEHCRLCIISPSLPEALVLATRILHTRPTRGARCWRPWVRPPSEASFKAFCATCR